MEKKRITVTDLHEPHYKEPLPLLDSEEMKEALAKINAEKDHHHFSKPKQKKGRPSLKKGRVKFTTMIKPAKRDKLKHLAIEKNKSLADMLEEMIDRYILEQEQ